MNAQIDISELGRLVQNNAAKVLDASWALDGTDMRALYAQSHIPDARFFDLEAVSDRENPLPHMAPPPEIFAEAVGGLGISHDDPVVIYDRQGLFSAARVWWTFRLMGHEKVQVLLGGLPAWQAAGLPVESGAPVVSPVIYTPNPRPELSINSNELRKILETGDYVIIDARAAQRFAGTVPEPRPGLRPGHIPGSLNLPFSDLITDGALKPVNELKSLFARLGLSQDRAVITTCGSGVTAAIVALALDEAGYDKVRLYDGSWAEWGQESLDTPVETG